MGLAAKREGQPRADGSEVAYAASHDLRAPIVAICQLVESIQEDFAAELPPEVTRRLVLIRERADRFDGLLKRLSRFWRAANSAERPSRVDLADMVAEVSRSLELPPEAVIEADQASLQIPRRAFRRVLDELIANAVHHAGRKDVHVRVGAARRVGGWEVWVADNGAGIPPRYRERVWRLFATLEANGAGLGLAIARRVVETYGGRAWIDQAPTGGTRIGLFWPAPT